MNLFQISILLHLNLALPTVLKRRELSAKCNDGSPAVIYIDSNTNINDNDGFIIMLA